MLNLQNIFPVLHNINKILENLFMLLHSLEDN